MLNLDEGNDVFLHIFDQKCFQDLDEDFELAGERELLNLAKEKFSRQIDYEFWSAISAATGFEMVDLKNQYSEMVPADFDYRNLNDLGNLGYIVDLFIKLGIDVVDYNETAFVKISVKNYFASKVPEYKKQNRDKYLSFVAKQILDAHGNKEDFEEKKRAFEFYEPEIKNSVLCDIAKSFEAKFGYATEDLKRETGDYTVLIKQLPEREVPVEEIQPATISASTHDFDYKKIYEEISGATDGKSMPQKIVAPIVHKPREFSSEQRKHGSVVDRESSDTKIKNGFDAEAKVYATIKHKIAEYNGSVEWVSENGKKAGECANGYDGCGYDIQYTDSSGKVHYVEVKATSSDNLEFIMTRNEVDFASAHRDQYELWFVFIKNGEPGDPYELGNIFVFDEGEDFFQNHSFSVEQSDFKLKAKLVEPKV